MRRIIYIVLLLAIVLFYVWSETVRPREVDWSETFRTRDRIPYGTSIAFNSLSYLFPTGTVNRVKLPVLEQLEQSVPGRKTAYCFIGNYLRFDEVELRHLVEFVGDGNYVFISASWLPDTVYSYFNLKRESRYGNLEHRLLRPELSAKSYRFRDWNSGLRIKSGFEGEVLGTLTDTLHSPDFVRFRYGKGELFLNMNNFAFTNYYLLDSLQEDYYSRVLSYLPEDSEIWWDEYKLESQESSAAAFRVILRYPALRHAWFLLLATGIFYLLFRIRREQRAIPKMTPPANKTVEFVTAVSALYYKERDHAAIARKRIESFLDEMTCLYKIPFEELNERAAGELAGHSGVELKKAERLFELIGKIREGSEVSESRLKELVKLMNLFENH